MEQTITRLLKNKIILLIELLPYGHDIYLVLAKNRLGISYRGVFENFDQAESAASKDKSSRYDSINAKKATNMEIERQGLDQRFLDIDYPLLFWLSQLINKTKSIFELGGSLGHFFYSIQKFMTLPDQLQWTIAELPHAAELGRKFAQERNEKRLIFIESDSLSDDNHAEIFMTAGTLQYMQEDIFEIINKFVHRPKHLLIHNLPVHHDISFWTLQNLGICEVPYRIYSRKKLLGNLQENGYNLVSQWSHPRKIEIPFNSKYQIQEYMGFYFELQQ